VIASPAPWLARLRAYAVLARLHRPIGIYLLLWPTLVALWLAAGGMPAWHNLLVFSAGVVLMRSAGCVVNDYFDRHVDGHVARTRERPLVTGAVSPREALALFVALLFVALLLVLATNVATVALAAVGAALATLYPLAKRHTRAPQLVLGAAFSWGIPMAWTAQAGHVDAGAWWLFAANLAWTVAYDTEYAMVDRDDDVRIGIGSTAILFGRADRLAIGVLQAVTLLLLGVLGHTEGLGVAWWPALAVAAMLFARQQWLIRDRARDGCFAAFLANHHVGAVLFAGAVLGTWGT
jgi:4-hydroxybenzoate polyprenyltransferase